MLLNNRNISAGVEWRPMPGMSGYVGAFVQLRGEFFDEPHTLQHVSGVVPFGAVVYGLGATCGFAYPAGFCVDDIRVIKTDFYDVTFKLQIFMTS